MKTSRALECSPAPIVATQFLSRCRQILAMCLLIFSLVGINGATLPKLTNVAQIKQLSMSEAKRAYPVLLRGVITFQNPSRDVVVHDGDHGIFVARNNPTFDLFQGQSVEIEGTTGFVGYAPRIEARQITVLGESELPTPRHIPFDSLISGREDCQWIEVRGVVRSVTPSGSEHVIADLSVEGNRLRVWLMNFTNSDSSKLIDSTIRARGVLGSNKNNRQQLIAPLLWVAGANLFVEEVSLEDPFAVSARPISSLLRFAPFTAPNHRVKVQGSVTHQNPGHSVFIRGESDGLWLRTLETARLQPGDIIEAVGFEKMGQYAPVLEDVIYRRMEGGPPPLPKKITGERALNGDYDSDLVTIDGELLDSSDVANERILVVQADPIIFKAHLERGSNAPAGAFLPNGSRLRLTGIYLIDEVWGNVDNVQPKSFHILLRSPGEVMVLQAPSWWTLSRLLGAIAALGVVSLGAFGWVASLRRRVNLQTSIIAKKIQREAVLEERNRVAREIHDTLAQSYSGIGFQLEAVGAELPRGDAKARERLEIAKQMVRHGQEEFRRSLSNLRARELERGTLSEALAELGRQMTAGSGVQFDLKIEGPTRGLTEAVEGNVLRIAQECLTNALRHAEPTRVNAQLVFEAERVRFHFSDDGIGFDTHALESLGDRHFGWRGIRERAEQIHAEVALNSELGRGTSIAINIPA